LKRRRMTLRLDDLLFHFFMSTHLVSFFRSLGALSSVFCFPARACAPSLAIC
jgi:hypothetical protein